MIKSRRRNKRKIGGGGGNKVKKEENIKRKIREGIEYTIKRRRGRMGTKRKPGVAGGKLKRKTNMRRRK